MWYDILDTNLSGLYLITKAVLKHIPDHSGGRIINISSVLGKFGVAGYAAYCATKHGMIGFTRALALEVVDRGITVNTLCPGWVDTEMARQGIDESALNCITPENSRNRQSRECRSGASSLLMRLQNWSVTSRRTLPKASPAKRSTFAAARRCCNSSNGILTTFLATHCPREAKPSL
jgi:NAD(P)-dependent dehydrogenase (short-subunit alcohol dehydrogenase family)